MNRPLPGWATQPTPIVNIVNADPSKPVTLPDPELDPSPSDGGNASERGSQTGGTGSPDRGVLSGWTLPGHVSSSVVDGYVHLACHYPGFSVCTTTTSLGNRDWIGQFLRDHAHGEVVEQQPTPADLSSLPPILKQIRRAVAASPDEGVVTAVERTVAERDELRGRVASEQHAGQETARLPLGAVPSVIYALRTELRDANERLAHAEQDLATERETSGHHMRYAAMRESERDEARAKLDQAANTLDRIRALAKGYQGEEFNSVGYQIAAANILVARIIELTREPVTDREEPAGEVGQVELGNFLYEHEISMHTPDTDAGTLLGFFNVTRKPQPSEASEEPAGETKPREVPPFRSETSWAAHQIVKAACDSAMSADTADGWVCAARDAAAVLRTLGMTLGPYHEGLASQCEALAVECTRSPEPSVSTSRDTPEADRG